MSQINLLIKTLKDALKARGKTYYDVAAHLGLSDASIKRMFANNQFSLDRLEQICLMVDMQLSDLIKKMQEKQHHISHLTEEQEEKLANDQLLLLVAVCARNYFTVADIIDTYEITYHQCINKLAILDKLKLIELLPGDRIKLRLSPEFRWLKDGPIERLFKKQIQKEFLLSSFLKETELQLFLTGYLPAESVKPLIKSMMALAHDFTVQHSDAKSVSLDIKANYGMYLAIRPWELSDFAKLRKNSKTTKS